MNSTFRPLFSASLCALLALSALSRAQTQTPPPAAGTGAGTVKFTYGGDAAEIGATFIDNLLFLPARVNLSPPSALLLDTTAARSSLAPDRAAQIDRVNVTSPSLDLAGIGISLPDLPAVPNPDFGPRVGRPYEGTLGRDFLSSVVLQIDYSRQTVRAFAPAGFQYKGTGGVFPLTQASGMPVISLRFMLEKGKPVEANFIVDSALDASLVLENKFLASHRLKDEAGKTIPAIDPISGAPSAALGRLRDVQLGKTHVDAVLALYTDQPLPDAGTPVAGAIGAGLLRRFIVTFDYAHHQMILEPNGRFEEPDQEDKSGMLFVAKGDNFKTFEVVNVEPATPAVLAGVKKGDIIAGIDTDPAADLTLLAARELFKQVGHKYKVVLQRGDQTQEVTIQMRRYF